MFLWFACHIMDLVNRAIQYDRGCTEKPFLLKGHSLMVWPPGFNAAPMHVALQHLSDIACSRRRAA
jgi:hypothetical protein